MSNYTKIANKGRTWMPNHVRYLKKTSASVKALRNPSSKSQIKRERWPCRSRRTRISLLRCLTNLRARTVRLRTLSRCCGPKKRHSRPSRPTSRSRKTYQTNWTLIWFRSNSQCNSCRMKPLKSPNKSKNIQRRPVNWRIVYRWSQMSLRKLGKTKVLKTQLKNWTINLGRPKSLARRSKRRHLSR